VFVTPIFGRFNLAQVARSREPSVWAKCARRELRSLTTARAIRRILRSATLVLPNTGAEARSIERSFRTQDGMRSAVLPNGIWVRNWTVDRSALDRKAFLRSRGLPEDVRAVVACVGRIEPRKNQRGLVRAMAQVPDAAVVFVGPESNARYASRVRRDALALLGDRVAFLGPLSQTDVRDVLAHADVHALPSYLEVASTVAMEAAAAGCEVVLSRSDASDEYWGDRVHACNPDDSDSIARAIAQSISSPRQPQLALRAQDFDFDSLGRLAADLYRSSL
jgi:glycosyltransferase involved in cell wall biosynthesis